MGVVVVADSEEICDSALRLIKIGEDLAILDFWNKHKEVMSHLKLEMEKEKGQWRVIKYDYTPYRR